MKTVAILCAARKTAYRDIPGVEIYDEVRDCRNFPGGMPVIAHPPCRRWTRFGMAMMKARFTRHGIITPESEVEAERELGLFSPARLSSAVESLNSPPGPSYSLLLTFLCQARHNPQIRFRSTSGKVGGATR